jgi:hypothetical protein
MSEEFKKEYNDKIDRLEKRMIFLENRISMLESNAIGFPIPYLENNKTTIVCDACGKIKAVFDSKSSQFYSCVRNDCPTNNDTRTK